MKKLIVTILVLANVLFAGAFAPSQAEKDQLNKTLNALLSQQESALQENKAILNTLLTSTSALVGGWEDTSYRYTYKMVINASERIAIFMMQAIHNPNNALAKMLNMQPNMMLLIDANRANKLVWNGYKEVKVCDPLQELLVGSCNDVLEEDGEETVREETESMLWEHIRFDNDYQNNVKTDLNLFDTLDDIAFDWNSTNESVVNSNTGVVTLPDADSPVTLGGHMSFNTNSTYIGEIEPINLTVKAK
ncbi:MAG: hypothetical protein U9N49_04000 [Campylobacterota bacterium]|nr:hypothetical protein [Campylobacterota bacterium]